MTSSQAKLASRGWRFRNSIWIIGTTAFGFLTWASFLYVGISAKRRAWLIASAGYALALVATIVLLEMTPELPDGKADPSTWHSNVMMIVFLGLWFGGFGHALVANRSWLKFKAAQDDTPWFVEGSNSSAAAVPQPATPDAHGFGVDTSQYYSNAPAPSLPSPPPYAPPPAPPGPPPSALVPPAQSAAPNQSEPAHPGATAGRAGLDNQAGLALIDVNTATLADLLGRAGLDAESAERAIVERHRRGGFQSLDEFVSATQLPPHVYAKVRSLLTLTVPSTQRPQPGLPSESHQPGVSGGRVLDL